MKFNIYLKTPFGILMLFSLSFSNAQDGDSNSFARLNTLTFTPWHVAFADMNNDGIQDMVGVYGNSNTDIEIHLGTGNDSFELSTVLDGSSGVEYYDVILGNLNGDNVPDIVAVSGVSGIVFQSDGLGVYEEIIFESEYVSYDGKATSIIDINNDQHQDLIYNNQIHINDGIGNFTTLDWHIPANGPIVAMDFDDDGIRDLVVGDPGSGSLWFYNGYGDGTFNQTPTLEFSVLPSDIKIYDVNSDELSDIILLDPYDGKSEIIILFNDEFHEFSASDTILLSHNYHSILDLVDINLDGIPDIVGSNDMNIHYWPLTADGSIGELEIFDTNMGSIRGFQFTNAIGEDFEDLVVMSGFGTIKMFSDKLNATITQTKETKVYDNSPISDFFEISTEVYNIIVSYDGFETEQSDVGNYGVTVSIEDDAYEGQAEFDVSVTKQLLTATAADVTIVEGDVLPDFEVEYENFAEGDNESSLSTIPTATTEAVDEMSPAGNYVIVLTGGEADNYSFQYVNGTLTIVEPLSVQARSPTKVYPNPAAHSVIIESSKIIENVSILNMDGTKQEVKFKFSSIDISNLPSGVYLLNIGYRNASNDLLRLIKQ